MKIDTTFLKSKIGSRILVLFIVCALGPIVALGIISFTQVMNQLNEQSERRLHQESKIMGMAIMERLFFLEAELQLIASTMNKTSVFSLPEVTENYTEHLKKRFKGIKTSRHSR